MCHGGIEPGFDLFIETSVVFFPLGGRSQFGVDLSHSFKRFLEGAAFAPGDRVSQSKGDPIDSAVLLPVGETAASRVHTSVPAVWAYARLRPTDVRFQRGENVNSNCA